MAASVLSPAAAGQTAVQTEVAGWAHDPLAVDAEGAFLDGGDDLTSDDDLAGNATDDSLKTNVSFVERAAETPETEANATVQVRASNDSAVFPVNVSYNHAGGSADGDDFDGGDGDLTFTEAGQVREVVLDLRDDAEHEGPETVELNLTSDDALVAFGTRNHTHTILDDDPANRAPSAPDAMVEATAGTPASGALPGEDPNGDDLTWYVVVPPAHGRLDVDADTGSYTYAPDPGFLGPDVFEYRVTDGSAADRGRVDVSVTAEGGGAGDGGGDDGTGSHGTWGEDGDTATSTEEGGSSTGASSGAEGATSGAGSADDGAGSAAWLLVVGAVAVVGCGGAIAYGYYRSQMGGL